MSEDINKALEKLGLNPDIRLRQMFDLGKLAAPVQDYKNRAAAIPARGNA